MLPSKCSMGGLSVLNCNIFIYKVVEKVASLTYLSYIIFNPISFFLQLPLME